MSDEAREILKRLDVLAPEEVARLALAVLLVSDDVVVWRVAGELDDQQRAGLVAALLPAEQQRELARQIRAADGEVTH